MFVMRQAAAEIGCGRRRPPRPPSSVVTPPERDSITRASDAVVNDDQRLGPPPLRLGRPALRFLLQLVDDGAGVPKGPAGRSAGGRQGPAGPRWCPEDGREPPWMCVPFTANLLLEDFGSRVGPVTSERGEANSLCDREGGVSHSGHIEERDRAMLRHH